MKTIATVKSFTHSHESYTVMLYNRHWQCTCRDWFFRRHACKHIKAVRTLRQVSEGAMTQKKVQLTKKGVQVLSNWRQRHGMPLVRPAGYKPEPKEILSLV